ncbi:MAG: magnesium transporter [Candidatus Bipolaricaulota bacterium]
MTYDTEAYDLHPAELADRLKKLPEEEAADELLAYDLGYAGEVLESLDPWQAAGIFQELGTEVQANLLSRMPSDDSVDLLQELPESERQSVLERLDELTRKRFKSLLKYPKDTAGGTMSLEVVSLPESIDVGTAIEELRNMQKQLEEINYVYVTDGDGKLAGVLPLRNIAFRDPDMYLRDVMNEDVKTVFPEFDREKVARIFDKYDYIALPVVDHAGRLLGVITFDDVIDILRQESTEDMLEMVGISGAAEESIWTPWSTSVKHRLPWLVVNLGTALLAAVVVGLFENTIARFAVLAVFMPVIAGQGGNSGAQTVSILVRGIALGEIGLAQSKRALIKETTLGLAHGLVIGFIVAGIAYAWTGSVKMALIVGISMILSMVVAGIAGVVIPLGLRRVGYDPALSATIWMTTITDVAGFLFLLGLGAWLLT